METDRKWVVVRIDGKIAGLSADYRVLEHISAYIAKRSRPESGTTLPYKEITANVIGLDEVWEIRRNLQWDDLLLFGTDFQKKVWRKLWDLTHTDVLESNIDKDGLRLISYSDFAELLNNRAGVRAVAHAVGLNPVSVIIPCHLVIPKETIDRIEGIRKKAETTIFKGDDLCLDSILKDPAADFGEYALGKKLKRELIIKEFSDRGPRN